MESLEAKKVRLLARYLAKSQEPWELHLKWATEIISLLDEIEQAYWIAREEADSQTHIGETYSD